MVSEPSDIFPRWVGEKEEEGPSGANEYLKGDAVGDAVVTPVRNICDCLLENARRFLPSFRTWRFIDVSPGKRSSTSPSKLV